MISRKWATLAPGPIAHIAARRRDRHDPAFGIGKSHRRGVGLMERVGLIPRRG